MVDWAEVTRVTSSCIVSVFLVLVLIQLTVQGASAIINGISRKNAKEK